MLRSSVMVILLLAALPSACILQRKPEPEYTPDPEQAAVASTVQRYIDAMASRDADALASTMLPEASLHAAAVEPSGELRPPRSRTAEEFVDWLRGTTDAQLGRIWGYEVRVHDRVATLWTPYDFWRNGEFSHCGVEIFTLVKLAEGWRIASITYTTRTEGCEPSPLGPPATD